MVEVEHVEELSEEKEFKWHAMSVKKVLSVLKTCERGLTEEEVSRRLKIYGFNEIREEKREHPIFIFIRQFKSFLIIILLASVVISLFLGEVLDALSISAIILACAVLGFVEEYRSEKALELLKKLAAPTACVIRNGEERVIPAREIVPGDIIVLSVGDKVPADARLIKAVNLRVNEAPLTGESTPVEKSTEPLPEDTPVPDRSNMVFCGTTITYGRGIGVVTSTGMNTEFGKIAAMVQVSVKEETPLEKRMEYVGKVLGSMCLAVCGVVAFLGFLRGHSVIEMLIWGVSLAIAAVPEALPAVVTGALAIGVREMAKRNAIVRRLPAVETLGCTSVICSDKTGTMTKGEMTVREIYVNDKTITVTGVGYTPEGEFYINNKRVIPENIEELMILLKAAALCNDAKLKIENGRWIAIGDTTEASLIVSAIKAGITKEELEKTPRLWEIPFTSERKRMTTIHREKNGKLVAYMKGAPEIVLNKCKYIQKNGQIIELTEEEKRKLLEINEDMAKRALRNLAVAYKYIQGNPEEFNEEDEKDFVFLGIVGMMDPPREEVKEAIKYCKEAGIKVVMVTGDHKLTAMAVAKELGMIESGEEKILTGAELDKLSDEEFESIVEKIAIYARVSPEHKVRIVDALKKKGFVVAMTGDGINDAPALKKADIGVAMGITGTDVTKEASDMVLADDNFATIVAAVKEGRRIFDNIKKYLTYLLQCNIAEIFSMLIATLLAWPLPLTAIQLLWVNLTTDGLPALALGVDPADPDVMRRPPRNPKESVFSKEVKTYLTLVPPIVSAIILFGFLIGMQLDLVRARTIAFTTMVFIELAIALTCRSLKYPLLKVNPMANKFLWIAIITSLIMQLIVLYVPQLHPIFDVTFPKIQDIIFAIISALIIFTVIEIGKTIILTIKQGKVK